ncbi:hypothetical protein SAMD00019534_118690 [Acytostelium subglobosum LB1]|uniref:hypothetical protein n=1 Tax=Acytostelium subglobosum LB1 TaxID=1410327 RepID=UPI0006449685|nr:hypothetical protein SAMD00019534_118690 [Acytostelium subglobosum LB1]GAM28693.1 hypothetical protein SAMD00019534_118690 [Acytostelium subglobosum LB1]|eukprot:XP_012748471.1 hypothetical protein SAMD00019534_118690 [Acytostelium subglobosum LB1]
MSDPFEDNIESVEVHEEIIEGDYVPTEEGETITFETVSDGNNNNAWSQQQDHSMSSPSGSANNYDSKPKTVEVPAAVREFNEKHDKALAEKKRVSDEKRRKKLEDAQKSLDNFYAERESKKKTALKNNRDHNKTLENDNIAASAGKDDSWEAVVSMIDLTAKPTSASSAAAGSSSSSEKKDKNVPPPSKDTTRMREVLLRLKNKPVH